ncbi:MAG TPA: hypothetical protein VNA15_09125 [Candidatus Angelobacter sp.]|nr:hypothetical protein [Candidatus Angelobacter sp.]
MTISKTLESRPTIHSTTSMKSGPTIRLRGLPINLNMHDAAEIMTNKHLKEFSMPDFEKIYLSESMAPLANSPSIGVKEFLVDDHRGAVSNTPALTIDGTEFYLSVKGIGSTTNPFSHQLFGPTEMSQMLKHSELRERIANSTWDTPRYITGELWLRGSPYGGQGLQHATVSMKVSEMADLTSIHGFRIAPLVKIVFLPDDIENNIKQLYWYRRFRGKIVQETRLVPSNIRIYFHSGSTIGGHVDSVFDLFGIDTDEKALRFLQNFVKSGIAYLTLFVRTITQNPDGTYNGYDFYDVWLDKDAVLAPDGTIYFVDLEGLEWITLTKDRIQEKIHDQIYRSLYEFMYAYEQIERERSKRFGNTSDRKIQFEHILKQALAHDEVVRPTREGESLELIVGNILGDESILGKFPIIDW